MRQHKVFLRVIHKNICSLWKLSPLEAIINSLWLDWFLVLSDLDIPHKIAFLLEGNKKIFNYKKISQSNMSLTRKHTSKQHVVLSTLIYFSYLLQSPKHKLSFFKSLIQAMRFASKTFYTKLNKNWSFLPFIKPSKFVKIVSIILKGFFRFGELYLASNDWKCTPTNLDVDLR